MSEQPNDGNLVPTRELLAFVREQSTADRDLFDRWLKRAAWVLTGLIAAVTVAVGFLGWQTYDTIKRQVEQRVEAEFRQEAIKETIARAASEAVKRELTPAISKAIADEIKRIEVDRIVRDRLFRDTLERHQRADRWSISLPQCVKLGPLVGSFPKKLVLSGGEHWIEAMYECLRRFGLNATLGNRRIDDNTTQLVVHKDRCDPANYPPGTNSLRKALVDAGFDNVRMVCEGDSDRDEVILVGRRY